MLKYFKNIPGHPVACHKQGGEILHTFFVCERLEELEISFYNDLFF